jgi:hypothetical protein
MGKLSGTKVRRKPGRRKDRVGQPTRTRTALMFEMIGLASGKPPESFEWVVDALRRKHGLPDGDVMDEAEYQETRAGLMEELDGIRSWLVEGAAQAKQDPELLREFDREYWNYQAQKN